MTKRILLGFFLVGAITMIVMSSHYFLHEHTGIMKGKEISNYLWYRTILRIHILGGIVAITTGPFQFITRFRVRYPHLHKRLGYVYVSAIVISSIMGLIIAQFAMGGWVAALGFSCLAIVWLYTTIGAVSAVINGDLLQHRLLIMFSYALTFSSIPQRTMLAAALISDIPFMDIYRMSAWLSWMFNLGVAYLIFLYSQKQIKSQLS